jgi:hypothetical protein
MLTGPTPPAYTVVPSNVIPTTTDIKGILPAPSHDVNSGRDNSAANPNDNTEFFFNAKVQTREDMVNIEKFIPFVQGVQCGSGSFKLTFTTNEAFQKARDSWPTSAFPLMTNDDYCGDGQGGRTFYE